MCWWLPNTYERASNDRYLFEGVESYLSRYICLYNNIFNMRVLQIIDRYMLVLGVESYLRISLQLIDLFTTHLYNI
jgi:hypothetical protein